MEAQNTPNSICIGCRRDDLDHLADTLKKYYSIKIDPDGKELVKIELDWEYTNKKVHLLMKPYVDKSLQKFDNVVPTKRQHSPYPQVETKYGSKQQFAEYDKSEPVGNEEKTCIQKITGKFLWYGMEEGLMAQSSPPSVQLR